jgi:hypothetical protein
MQDVEDVVVARLKMCGSLVVDQVENVVVAAAMSSALVSLRPLSMADRRPHHISAWPAPLP